MYDLLPNVALEPKHMFPLLLKVQLLSNQKVPPVVMVRNALFCLMTICLDPRDNGCDKPSKRVPGVRIGAQFAIPGVTLMYPSIAIITKNSL